MLTYFVILKKIIWNQDKVQHYSVNPSLSQELTEANNVHCYLLLK